ncbi:glycosyl hydrolase family 2 [Gelidibacter sediminis]|uniref:Glycosyl hydrolase family 2 n=1 Tax=Gelidibacter sediminis TaxID=1608710 RepID=A0A4R7PZA2_9FLAO|nr:glycoside hydrolase family 2 TIM barrel-domain containing protein [Gelidibacter sediminis]TDU39762.1 glycosyl hydrolase family 2 [Gelidibacter sediminis]
MKRSVTGSLLVGLSLVMLLFVVFRTTYATTKIVDKTRKVFIIKDKGKFQLYRNGVPFKIRGATGHSYLKDLADIGANTVRVYDFKNIGTLLDEAHRLNLAVIVDIPLSKYTDGDEFYSDLNQIRQFKDTIKNLVNSYKHHPALLFWSLGNELDYPLVLRKNDFINTYNELIDLIQTEDPDHPVGTSIVPSRPQTLSIHLHSPQLDFIGFNAFGNLQMIKPLMRKINLLTNAMPYYISEYGNNGPWEEEGTLWSVPIEQTSTKKAEQYSNYYKSYIQPNTASMGDLVFYWGHKQEHTHTWFSIFDDQGRKSEVFYTLKTQWGQPENKAEWPPQINYMRIDNQGSKDTLIYNAKTIKTAEILMVKEPIEDYQYEWEIYKEGWNYQQTKKEARPENIPFTTIAKNANSLTFKVPEKEGPYRMFVYVYDQKGNFATTNVPFYVLN